MSGEALRSVAGSGEVFQPLDAEQDATIQENFTGAFGSMMATLAEHAQCGARFAELEGRVEHIKREAEAVATEQGRELDEVRSNASAQITSLEGSLEEAVSARSEFERATRETLARERAELAGPLTRARAENRAVQAEVYSLREEMEGLGSEMEGMRSEMQGEGARTGEAVEGALAHQKRVFTENLEGIRADGGRLALERLDAEAPRVVPPGRSADEGAAPICALRDATIGSLLARITALEIETDERGDRVDNEAAIRDLTAQLAELGVRPNGQGSANLIAPSRDIAPPAAGDRTRELARVTDTVSRIAVDEMARLRKQVAHLTATNTQLSSRVSMYARVMAHATEQHAAHIRK